MKTTKRYFILFLAVLMLISSVLAVNAAGIGDAADEMPEELFPLMANSCAYSYWAIDLLSNEKTPLSEDEAIDHLLNGGDVWVASQPAAQFLVGMLNDYNAQYTQHSPHAPTANSPYQYKHYQRTMSNGMSSHICYGGLVY